MHTARSAEEAEPLENVQNGTEDEQGTQLPESILHCEEENAIAGNPHENRVLRHSVGEKLVSDSDLKGQVT
ncbi:hypothetical protein NECAME_00172 [Necator americanus]|uniref:Uncharacterized protein n=1 Tax=Necator americanus TaxID=51031 RepID=W2TJ68_NECAM|nr:hypothetical protein NECAME_00172 [Necator americanus]ETN81823.1 hypothetical protein NECAME_00172 [Necator americanus]